MSSVIGRSPTIGSIRHNSSKMAEGGGRNFGFITPSGPEIISHRPSSAATSITKMRFQTEVREAFLLPRWARMTW